MTPDEFEVLYTTYEKKWLDQLTRVTKNRDIAYDILHDTVIYFLDGRLGKLTINPESMFRMKLFWILHNTVFPNQFAKQDTIMHTGALSLSHEWTQELVAPCPVDTLESADATTPLERGIQAALATLPDWQQDVFCLLVFAGLNATQVGEIMKRPAGTIRWVYNDQILPALRLALANVGIGDPPSDDNRTHGTIETVA